MLVCSRGEIMAKITLDGIRRMVNEWQEAKKNLLLEDIQANKLAQGIAVIAHADLRLILPENENPQDVIAKFLPDPILQKEFFEDIQKFLTK
jgi:hypothetical protein